MTNHRFAMVKNDLELWINTSCFIVIIDTNQSTPSGTYLAEAVNPGQKLANSGCAAWEAQRKS